MMLGEAYVKCGRHMAGLKALEHALELDSSSWIAMYHIADVHVQLGSLDEAIDAYERVARTTGDKEVGVAAASAQAMLALGQQSAAGGFRERSRRAFHGAIGLAEKVLSSSQGHRAWAWKVAGDAMFGLGASESNMTEAEASAVVIEPVLQLLVDNDTDRRSAVEGIGHASQE